MLYRKNILSFFTFFVLVKICTSEEIFCNINGKKSLQKVSQKFLSITIDPAILLTGVNLSDTSLLLAKNLAPAYIRLAGPSTKYVKFANKDSLAGPNIPENFGSIFATPSIWFGINEWFNLANLTPVYGINDDNRDKDGAWNSKDILPLLDISDKFNFTGYWQLGFDCTGKNEQQFENDLKLLRKELDKFPDRKQSWKIIGSDTSKCFSQSLPDEQEFKEIVEAVMIEPFEERGVRQFQHVNTDVNLWTTVPKSAKRTTFNSAIEFAKTLGDVAKSGYKVVYREPRLFELSSVTPVYWLALLHKKLMGANVLEVKSTFNIPGTSIYAHCTRKQNSFVRRGAITVVLVNGGNENFTANIRLSLLPSEKSMEIQSYILTSENENSTNTYLNDKELSMDLLKTKKILIPKLRRSKASTHIPLEIPSKSIGFFVLTNARASVCIDSEEDIDLILEEINVDQQFPLSKEMNFDISPRGSFSNGEFNHLDSIRNAMLNELKSDEKFYSQNKNSFKVPQITKEGRKVILDNYQSIKPYRFDNKRKDLNQLLFEEQLMPVLSKDDNIKQYKKSFEKPAIELTSDEIKSILRRRAKALAMNKRIQLNSDELDILLDRNYPRKITKRDINRVLLEERWKLCNYKQGDEEMQESFKENNENTLNNKAKRSIDGKSSNRASRNMLENESKKIKRDINMDLLKRKSETISKKKPSKPLKSLFADHDDKEATIRLPGQSSDELFKSSESIEEETEEIIPKKIPSEIYAELATEDDEEEEYSDTESEEKNIKNTFNNKKLITNPLFHKKTPLNMPGTKKRKSKKKKIEEEVISSDEALQFLSPSAEFDDIEEGLPCIHEFFGDAIIKPKIKMAEKKKPVFDEIWEYTSPIKKSPKSKKKNKEINDDMGFMDDYESDDFAARRKRESEKITKKEYKAYKEYMKKELQLLRQQMKKDKLAFIEEKRKNKMELDKLRKVGITNKQIHSNDNSLTNLNNLKLKLTEMKNRLGLLSDKDNNIENQLKSQHTDILNSTVIEQNSLKSTNESKINLKDQNINDIHIIQNVIPQNDVPSIVHVVKRSPIDSDKDLFGNYKSLTSALKPWTPSDILSLKHKKYILPFQPQQWYRPPNDNNILRNLHITNKYFPRKRRDINNDINSIENEIESFINDIQKESEQFIRPTIDLNNSDYQLILPNNDTIELKGESNDTMLKLVHQHKKNVTNNDLISESEKEISKNEPIITSLPNSDVSYLTKNQEDTLTTVISTLDKPNESLINKVSDIISTSFRPISNHIQRIPFRDEETERNFVEKITNFFQSVGRRVVSYFHDFVN